MLVTKEDYFEFSGIDLDIELRRAHTDNPSKAAEIFVKRVEEECHDFLRTHFFFEEIHEERFKKGVLHQIDYIRLNGEVGLDATESVKRIAPKAMEQFRLGGMCNISHPKSERLRKKNPWL